MQATGQTHQAADDRAAQQPAHHRANGARVGNGVFNVQAKIGAEDTKNGEGHVAKQLVRQAYRHLDQRYKQARLAHQPGDDQKNTHLLQQQQHKIKFVHTCQPHFLKARNIQVDDLTFFEARHKIENSCAGSLNRRTNV